MGRKGINHNRRALNRECTKLRRAMRLLKALLLIFLIAFFGYLMAKGLYDTASVLFAMICAMCVLEIYKGRWLYGEGG